MTLGHNLIRQRFGMSQPGLSYLNFADDYDCFNEKKTRYEEKKCQVSTNVSDIFFLRLKKNPIVF